MRSIVSFTGLEQIFWLCSMVTEYVENRNLDKGAEGILCTIFLTVLI
jgi:hypothetical protein